MTPKEQLAAARRFAGKKSKAQGDYFEALIEPGCKAAQADFKGFLFGGQTVMFEAKHTDTGRMEQDRVTPDQAERLERAVEYGALAFVLCSFGYAGFYRIPWTVWRDMKGIFGHKYITPEEAARFEVRIGGPGVLLFLGEADTK